MPDETIETQLTEFECWRAFRKHMVNCEVCGRGVPWTSSWSWVRDPHGKHIRVCFDCVGKAVLLLPSTVEVVMGDG